MESPGGSSGVTKKGASPPLAKGAAGVSLTLVDDLHLPAWLISRKSLAILSFVLFVFGTVAAVLQPVDFDSPPLGPTDAWHKFLYPVETHPHLRLPVIRASLNDIYVSDDGQRLWVVGRKGIILHSTDGGRCWMPQGPWKPAGAQGAACGEPASILGQLLAQGAIDTLIPTAHAAMAEKENPFDSQVPVEIPQKQVGKKVPLGTKDRVDVPNQVTLEEPLNRKDAPPAESEQSPPALPGRPDLEAVFFVDGMTGWVVGEGGTILQTADGGETWQRQASGTSSWLQDVMFLDSAQGWVVGSGGAILHTQDGGRTWMSQISGTQRDLSAVAFQGRRTGWVVGATGTILRTMDSGKTWTAQDTRSTIDLGGLAFVSERDGWAVGDEGTILHTLDGGTVWEAQPSGTSARLGSVVFSDAQQGWVIGKDGFILRTLDGGVSWVQQSLGQSTTGLSSIAVAATGQLWVTASDGGVFQSADAGATWIARLWGRRQSSLTLNDVFFADPKHGWAVGWDGLILRTSDGGATWDIRDSGTKATLTAVSFADRRQGWVVGRDGIILHTPDGGATWQAQGSTLETPHVDYPDVFFINARQGWAGSFDGTIVHTRDAGKTWQRQEIEVSGFASQLTGLFFVDEQQGWAVGGRVAIGLASLTGPLMLWHTVDAGETWQTQFVQMTTLPGDLSAGKVGSALNSVAFSDSRNGWVSASSGQLLRTTDGGETWSLQVVVAGAPALNRLVFSDPSSGWVVGDKGTIVHTTDGGDTWSPQPSGTRADLLGVSFVDARLGWVVGAEGTILHTTDGGKTWVRQFDNYSVSPAYWYWLLVAVSLLLLVLSLRPPKPLRRTDSVANKLASDGPLRPGEQDVLGLRDLADSLSRFLRNPSTTAPLTLAITGEWGSGKSSLMLWLRADLQAHNFCTVWFNAWHHQKGEALLAALFAHIRDQAIPPWLSLNGLIFRIRLAARRGARHWIWFSLVFLVFGALIGYGWSVLHAFLLGLSRLLQDPGYWWSIPWSEFLQDLSPLFAGGEIPGDVWLQFLAALLGLGGPMAALFKATRGFAVNPARLVTVDPGRRGGGLDPGARARFAREFEDVTWALGRRRLVIFIDDLDRCKCSNLMDVLETMNFLASSGDCFMVLGMAKRYVEACVATAYRDLAVALSKAPAHQADEKQEGFAFARNYLEKMVNLEIPVPVLDKDAARRLLSSEGEGDGLPAAGRTNVARRYLPRVAMLMAVIYGTYYGAQIRQVEPRPELTRSPTRLVWSTENEQALRLVTEGSGLRLSGAEAVHIEPGEAPVDLEIALRARDEALEQGVVLGSYGKGDARVELVLQQRRSPAAGQGEPEPARPLAEVGARGATADLVSSAPTEAGSDAGDLPSFSPRAQPEEGRLSRALTLLLLLIMLSGTYRALRLRSQEIVEDSTDFREALNYWQPWLQVRAQTPRQLKRYLNKVRYLAIRLKKESVPEPMLVALAALNFVDEGTLSDDERYRLLVGEVDLTPFLEQVLGLYPANDEERKHFDALKKALARSRDDFQAWVKEDERRGHWPPDAYRDVVAMALR